MENNSVVFPRGDGGARGLSLLTRGDRERGRGLLLRIPSLAPIKLAERSLGEGVDGTA